MVIIIAKEESINKLFNQIGLKSVQMKKVKKSKRKEIIRKMDFTGKDFFVLGITVNRNKVIDEIVSDQRFVKFTEKTSIQKYFDKILFSFVRDKMDSFCNMHGKNLSEISIDCDPDMSKTIESWRLARRTEDTKVYEFADAVSYAMKFNWSITGCRPVNLYEDIKEKMREHFLK